MMPDAFFCVSQNADFSSRSLPKYPGIPVVKTVHISRAGGDLSGFCPVDKSALVKYYISLIRPSPWNKLLGKGWKEIWESKHFSFLESTVYKVNYFSGKKLIKV